MGVSPFLLICWWLHGSWISGSYLHTRYRNHGIVTLQYLVMVFTSRRSILFQLIVHLLLPSLFLSFSSFLFKPSQSQSVQQLLLFRFQVLFVFRAVSLFWIFFWFIHLFNLLLLSLFCFRSYYLFFLLINIIPPPDLAPDLISATLLRIGSIDSRTSQVVLLFRHSRGSFWRTK